MGYGWEQLRCDYFASTAISVLGVPLETLGLTGKGVTSDGGVSFKSDSTEVEITYVPESFPKYVLNVLLRVLPSTRAVPLWYLVNEEDKWIQEETFSDPNQLRSLLSRVARETLSKYIAPLLVDTQQLRECVDRFSRYQGLPPE